MSIVGFTKKIVEELPRRFTLGVAMLVAISLMEGLGVVLLLPLLQMVDGSTGTDGGRIGEIIAGIFAAVGLPFTIESVLVFILIIVGLRQLLFLIQQKIALGSQFLYEAKLRERTYRAIFGAEWQFFVQTKLGHMTNTLAMEVSRVGQAYMVLNMLLTSILISSAYFVLALVLSWQVTLIVLGGGGTVVLLLVKQTRRGKAYGQAITGANQELQEEITEQLSAAKLIKGYGAQDAVVTRFRRYYDALAHIMYTGRFHNAQIRAAMEIGMTLMLVLTIYAAAVLMKIELTGLMLILFVFYRLAPRLSNAQTQIHQLNMLIPALAQVESLTEAAAEAAEHNGTRVLRSIETGVTLERVDFSYIADHPVLNDVSLEIPKGWTVAVVGGSGGGKSTIVDLVLGLIEPLSGGVRVDTVPLNEYDSATWKEKIGYVAQDTVLFNDTVRANIAWASPGATGADVVDAAKLAYAHDFIEDLPEGYDTNIGSRGVKLSGGQRQRLALARAVVRRPELLILDEATSALDAVSEKRIQAAVETLSETMTILIVTHRLATIRNADYIYVLHEGSVVEEGTWDALTAGKGRFQEQRHLQMLD